MVTKYLCCGFCCGGENEDNLDAADERQRLFGSNESQRS